MIVVSTLKSLFSIFLAKSFPDLACLGASPQFRKVSKICLSRLILSVTTTIWFNVVKKYRSELKDSTSSYILERVFEDIHEYEIYFEFSNKNSVDKLSLNRLRIIFKLNGRKLELYYPDNERTVELIVPITKKQNNPHAKAKLTKRYFDEYGDLIPKINLSLKNQLAATNKIIGPAEKIKKDLSSAIRNRRTVATRKAKKILKNEK